MTSTVKLALVSVSDKSGVLELVQGLLACGARIMSTGGTARLLQEAGLEVTEISQHTGLPEMLDGRVKTLHPKVHAGLLARRDLPEHMQTLAEQGIEHIDLVCVNLYPFRETVAREGVTLSDAIENIDIGGPAMLRSAAKNYQGVTVLTDPADYEDVLTGLRSDGGISLANRFRLAQKAFTHTARYDGAIANWLTSLAEGAEQQPEKSPQRNSWPAAWHAAFDRVDVLRYGENPHQSAAFYREAGKAAGNVFSSFRQLQGKELSYNNLVDADTAWSCVQSFGKQVACVIVKHANPCGVAVAESSTDAYNKAFKTDPVSAFGGIIAINVEVGGDLVEAMHKRQHFVEVIIAPSFSLKALELLQQKGNLRVLQAPPMAKASGGGVNLGEQLKQIGGGLLLQDADEHVIAQSDLQVVSNKQPTAEQISDLLFAWRVAKHVKSNAIVFCSHGMTLGIGAGQMSRVDSTRIASLKANNAGLALKGSCVASDAFFPFRDGVDVIATEGATAVIQPGGSVRDEEVIAAADEHGLAMLFTGVRHFRH